MKYKKKIKILKANVKTLEGIVEKLRTFLEPAQEFKLYMRNKQIYDAAEDTAEKIIDVLFMFSGADIIENEGDNIDYSVNYFIDLIINIKPIKKKKLFNRYKKVAIELLNMINNAMSSSLNTYDTDDDSLEDKISYDIDRYNTLIVSDPPSFRKAVQENTGYKIHINQLIRTVIMKDEVRGLRNFHPDTMNEFIEENKKLMEESELFAKTMKLVENCEHFIEINN